MNFKIFFNHTNLEKNFFVIPNLDPPLVINIVN